MALPDTSDDEQMALVGRLWTLRKARREAAQRLRDWVVPMLNNAESISESWDVGPLEQLALEIGQINTALKELG